MIRTGMMGMSEGNGHPFSFSAIINGYDEECFSAAGWPVILNYLKQQPADRFGLGDAQVTHAWTQDPATTRKLCDACRIGVACREPLDMLGAIDALIIARDDWESHAELALPFLRSGAAVFIDKPLTLDASQLDAFLPYLHSGKLMSCSGLRYAAELDAMRAADPATGAIKLISGAVLNGVEKYGIHLIEAVASLGPQFARPVSLTRLPASHASFVLTLGGGVAFHLDCLGAVGKTFHLSFFGEKGHQHFDLHDNFSAFRRTLECFFEMVRTGKPAIEPMETVGFMRLLAAAQKLEPGATVRFEQD